MSLGNSPTSPQAPPSDNGGAAVDNTSNGNQSIDGNDLPRPPNPTGASPEQLKQVSDVLTSEIGIATLLNRLKQSIASAKEFALFLKKRSSLEEDHAQGLKKLSRSTQDSMRRPDHRQGSFGAAYDEMMLTHDRMAENGMQFASSLHQMHDELIELAAKSERNRKTWKTNGLSAEQKVADMEQAMRKSKSKYDTLSDDYERVKTGEARQSGKMFGLKGHKSAAQHEEELHKKVVAADQTYKQHVQALQTEKAQLLSTTRPEAVKTLQGVIREIDLGVSVQMQNFAVLNEKLLLSNGLNVSPIRGPGGDGGQRSLRQAVSSIDNDKDLNSYVTAQHRNLPPGSGEIKYERNPVLGQPSTGNQATSGPLQQPNLGQAPPSFNTPPLGPGSRSSTLGLEPLTGLPQTSTGLDPPFPPGGPSDDPRPFSQSHNRSFSQGTTPASQGGHPPQVSGRAPTQRYGNGGGGSFGSSGPPQLGALPFQPSSGPSPPPASTPYQIPPQELSGSTPGPGGPPDTGRSPPPYGAPSQPPPGGMGGASAHTRPVFGLSLSRLYERDGLAVPMVIYQCIQAADLYGLALEGIYRQSGSMNHIQKLKNMFDTDSSNPALDFRNPENFYHDVNSVTGLLKLFLRDLPDPLLTHEHHDSFVAAAKHDDDVVRRDSLHAIINSLPDPNYATLRALTLHLYRVMDNAHTNRMNSHNLAVIFGPTLMGTDPSTAIADAGWQIKVIDTILQNTYQIFDED
ncbi:Rho GTPase-activating protein [Neonectria punicea]|uniref:Rho GTPase-activating protein n=1 Tax=Neonectria punicea TaxID=979145 RepID=A0ABR1GQ14_9HYPO